MRLLALLLLLATPAQANVLFIDLNNAPKEIEYARKAAEKAGRDFVVFPDAPEAKLELEARIKKADQAGIKQQKICEEAGSACEQATKELVEAGRAVDQLKSALINKENLLKLLSHRAKIGKPFSSIVVSGEDGTGQFFGQLGELGDLELGEMVAADPRNKAALRSLHLWGCKTTSPGALLAHWLKYFPNLALVTGFDERGPLKIREANWDFLGGVIARENELIAAGDSKKLQRLMRSIKGAKLLSVGMYSCGAYATHQEAFPLGEVAQRCDDYKKEMLNLEEKYLCYFRASEESCASPPKDVGSGPLRDFYNAIDKGKACKQYQTDPIFLSYSTDQAMRLIYFPEIQKNFAHLYRKELAEIDGILAGLGAPKGLRFAGLDRLSRRELIAKMEELLKFVREKNEESSVRQLLQGYSEKESQQNVRRLAVFQRTLTNSMMNLDSSCLPGNWIDFPQTNRNSCLDGGMNGEIFELPEEVLFDIPGDPVPPEEDPNYMPRPETLDEMGNDEFLGGEREF